MRAPDTLRFTALALALLAISTTATASDWNWTLTPYGWAADVTANVTVNDREVIDAEVDFSDLIDDADFAGMLHLEGNQGSFGFYADAVFADFGDEPRIYQRPNLPFPIEAESDLEMTILEAGGVWYPGGEGKGFGVHYGARVIDLDQEIDVLLVGGLPTDRRVVDVSETLVDGLVGARYVSEFGDGWSFALSGDVAAGDTDGSFSALAVFGYHFGASDQYALRFGYKHLAIEIENEDRLAEVETEFTMSGPVLGFTFRF